MNAGYLRDDTGSGAWLMGQIWLRRSTQAVPGVSRLFAVRQAPYLRINAAPEV
jgi:hypothetical protein